jgi:hypothetical protein
VSSIKSTDTLDLDCKSEFDDAEQKNGSDEMANMAEEKDAYQGNGFETINENDYYKMNSNWWISKVCAKMPKQEGPHFLILVNLNLITEILKIFQH